MRNGTLGLALLLGGCHAALVLRGTVTEGGIAVHTFDQEPRRIGAPVEGATIFVSGAGPQRCPDPLHFDERAVSGQDGSFETRPVVLLGSVATNWINVCVARPDYTPYSFVLEWDADFHEIQQRLLNVRLEKTQARVLGVPPRQLSEEEVHRQSLDRVRTP